MGKLGMAPIGGGRTRLRNQMKRLFRCQIELIHEHKHGDRSIAARVADRTEFWWNERKPDEQMLWDSKIRLGEDFFNEIIQHPVPIDMNILKAMKRSSMGLDLYLWLTYRTFTLKRPMRLSWVRLYRQFGAHPAKADDNLTVQNFRKDCLRELKKIKMAWPKLNYTTAPGVLTLYPSTASIPPGQQPPLPK